MPVTLGAMPGLLPIGARFVHRYSEWWGSDEPGAVLSRDRWRIEVLIQGYNGDCGYWITEFWMWDRNGGTCREQPKSLDYDDSRQLEAVFHARSEVKP